MKAHMVSKEWEGIEIDALPTVKIAIGDVRWIYKLLKWD